MNPAEFANISSVERDFWWYRGMRTILFRLLDPYLSGRKISRALDAGCGTGYFCHLLQTKRQWPVVPLDISWTGLRHARNLGVALPVQGDIAQLPFADRAFDLVISQDVLSHLQPGDEQLALREFARVLAPGGLAFVRTPALNLLRSRHSEFIHERQRFTRRRLLQLTAEAGLRPLRCSYANSLLLPVTFAKFRLWEPLLRRPAASGVEPLAPWLDHLLYQPLAIEAAWLAAGHNFPAGQSLIFIGEKIM